VANTRRTDHATANPKSNTVVRDGEGPMVSRKPANRRVGVRGRQHARGRVQGKAVRGCVRTLALSGQ